MTGFYDGVEKNSVAFGYFMCLVTHELQGLWCHAKPDLFAMFDLRNFCYPRLPAEEHLPGRHEL